MCWAMPRSHPRVRPVFLGDGRLGAMNCRARRLDVDPRVLREHEAQVAATLDPLSADHPTKPGDERVEGGVGGRWRLGPESSDQLVVRARAQAV